MENNFTENVSEKVKNIVAKIKEKTAMKAYRLNIIKNSKPDIFDSKFGGVPYWDMKKEYPIDSEGKRMMLLAQINFTKACLDDERLPKQGMLQFFSPQKTMFMAWIGMMQIHRKIFGWYIMNR